MSFVKFEELKRAVQDLTLGKLIHTEAAIAVAVLLVVTNPLA